MAFRELTKEEFKEILSDPKITNDKIIKIFELCYDSKNHRSTATEIGLKLNKSYQVIQANTTSFAKKINKHGYDINFSERQAQTKDLKYLDIFFRDDLEKTSDAHWILEIKPLLAEALLELGLIKDSVQNPAIEEMAEIKESPANELSASLKQFIKDAKWTFAKTYEKTWPHQYIVQDRVDNDLFLALAHHIDTFGYKSHFYKMEQTYFDYNGHTYWHMEDIINRCPEAETYHRKEKEGRLPAY